MTLSPPRTFTFLLSLIFAVVGYLMFQGNISPITLAGYTLTSFWSMTIAYVLLAVGCLLRGI
ncbi:hypothetical protein SAMN04515647_2200 [Cohaesibacter sp. ES.047]|uniref:hypothetical protein n=1 Tax=Cohaesibacter sp. ES.047 TaxID=1798205 RepID=UPI000BB903F3|nr:hypothetical protein [Cohaesibacter sp. ES.047]SNY91959.1 hypothetical protein SAMN04515647_2200 [Cohaesibacter sp. ES.047]